MAVTFTLLASGQLESNDNVITSSAFTTTSNKNYRVVWIMQNSGGSTAPAPTFTNNQSLTSTDVVSATNGNTDYSAGIFVHEYKVVTGASTTITATYGAGTFDNIYYRVYEMTGEDTTDSKGGTASGVSGVTNGAFALTLSSAPAAGDYTFQFIAGTLNTGTGAIDQDASFTEEFDAAHSAQFIREGSNRTGSTSTTAGWADVSNNSTPVDYYHPPVGVAFTVKAAAGGAASAVGQPWQNQGAMGVMVSM